MKAASYIVLVGMLSAAASTSEPYAYEPTGWHTATNQLSSYLGANDNRRQGLGVSATGAAAAAAGVSLAASFGTALLARQVGDDANRRIDDANQRIDSTCPKSTCTMIKNTADAACLKTECTATKTTASDACKKVKDILAVSTPTAPTTDAGGSDPVVALVPAMPDGVAKMLGDKTTADSYAFTKVIKGASATVNGVMIPGVTTILDAASAELGNNADTLAISVTDFNIFRLRVVDAFNTLENKVRELTTITDDLTC